MGFLKITLPQNGSVAVALGLLFPGQGLHLRLAAWFRRLMSPWLVIRGVIRTRTTLWPRTAFRPLLLRWKVMLNGR